MYKTYFKNGREWSNNYIKSYFRFVWDIPANNIKDNLIISFRRLYKYKLNKIYE